LCTLLFQVKVNQERTGKNRNPRKFKLLLWGPNNQHMDYRQAYFQPKCQTRLVNDLNGQTEAIIECSYCHVTGEWKYHRLRPDQPHAHHVMHVLQTLENVADNIDSDTLKKGLLQSHQPQTSVPEVHIQTPPELTFQSPEGQVDPLRTPIDVQSTEASPGWNDVIYDSPLEKPIQTPVVVPDVNSVRTEISETNKKRIWRDIEEEVEQREGEKSSKRLKT